MHPQNAYNLITEITKGKVDSLKAILKEINNDVEDNPYFNFCKIKSIHFARFVVLDGKSDSGNPYPAYLAFESNYDGALDDHLIDIIKNTKTNNGFDKVFSACKNFPVKENITDEDRVAFLKSDSHYHPYFYRGTWGRTVLQIRAEDQTRMDIQGYLDKHPELRAKPEKVVYEAIKNAPPNEISRSPYITQYPPKFLKRWVTELVLAGLILLIALLYGLYYIVTLLTSCKLFGVLPVPLHQLLLGVALLAVIVAGGLYGILRLKEIMDTELDKSYDPNEETTSLREAEDRIVQNQLTHLVEIKKGIFRLCLLKAVLWAVETLGIYKFNKGELGGIPSIHFARWIIIDKGKRLLFYSNFDGSWENYLGDFIDRAAVGLTAVWSNTRLFPKSKNLVSEGATDEQKFKSWTRMHQVQTQVWYSAYKTLTVENINNNTAIQEGLKKQLSDKEIKDWLLKL